MSNRERWIVYPLLFYALVMGFKATYQDPMEFRCRTIECQQLKVRMINGNAALAVATSQVPTKVIVVHADDSAAATPETEQAPDGTPRSEESSEGNPEESSDEAAERRSEADSNPSDEETRS